MIIDATFWVAISFFIFVGGLVYLKVPQKINDSLVSQINEMKKEINDLKKSSISDISKIATETSTEVINQIIGTEVNKSNVSAIVNDIVKRKIEKYI